MSSLNPQDVLALINDILQSAIVIFGASIVLYNLGHNLRDRVTRSFTTLLAFVVLVLITELLVTNAISPQHTESWLRVEWLGIAQVPAAMFHLSDALLVTTGDSSRRRRYFIRVAYLIGVIFFALVAFTELLVTDLIVIPRAPHLQAGPLFPLFTIYFLIMTGMSIYNLGRARQRSLTKRTQKRMTVILLALVAAPLSVYPYLLISGNPDLALPVGFWLILITGNIAVGVMFTLLTLQLIYFGATSPDRVIRVRLYKYLARVPLAATLTLVAYQIVNRTTSFLGLPRETAGAFAVVAVIILTEWAVHTFKRPLQKILSLDQNPEVKSILSLSERIVTTSELRDFLESILAAACDALRTPTAFIVSFMGDGPQLEMMVGQLADTEQILADDSIRKLATNNGNRLGQNGTDGSADEEDELPSQNGFIIWGDYWLRPLYDTNDKVLLGLLGIHGRGNAPNFDEDEELIFERLADQTASALEDRVLQQEVFAAVNNLLPQLNALQKRRNAAALGGTKALTSETTPTDDPDFSNLVKDALSHYWGGPKLTDSPLMRLKIVQDALLQNEGNPTNALRDILKQAIEMQRPEGERSMTRTEWLLYNILELKFVQGRKVRDVARRLAMSESDLYRKQRVAIENVSRTILDMERDTGDELTESATSTTAE